MAIDVNEIAVNFTANISAFSSAMNSVEAQMASVSSSMKSAGNSINALVTGIGLGAVVNQVKNLAESAIESYASLQNLQVSFAALTGSAESANKILQDIQGQKWNLPLENVEHLAQGMLAVGMNSAQAEYSVKAVNDASAVLGTGASGATTVANAIDKIALTGKVSALTIRPIVAQHIDAWGMLASYLHVSVPEAMAEVKKGAVSSADAIASLTSGMISKYSSGATAQLMTISGAFTSLKNDATVIMQGLGKAISDSSLGFAPLLKSVVNFADTLAGLINSGKSVGDALKMMIPPGLQAVIEGIAFAIGTLLTGAFLKSAFGIIENTIAAAPWIVAGGAILALGLLLYDNWNNLTPVLEALAVGLSLVGMAYVALNPEVAVLIGENIALAASFIAANAPIIAVVAVIMAIVGAIAIAMNSQEAFSNGVRSMGVALQAGWSKIKADTSAAMDGIALAVENAVAYMMQKIQDLLNFFGAASSAISNGLTNIQNAAKATQADLNAANSASASAAATQSAAWTGVGDSIGKMVSDAKAKLGSMTSFKIPSFNAADLLKGMPSFAGLDSGASSANNLAKAHKGASSAAKGLAGAHVVLATESEKLNAQINDLTSQLDIWGIANNKASDTAEYQTEKLKVLGQQQQLESQNLVALKQQLQEVAETQGVASKAFLDGTTAIQQAQLSYAKLTEATNNVKVALDMTTVTGVDAFIHDMNDGLQIWSNRTGNATTSTAYLAYSLDTLQQEMDRADQKSLALADASTQIGLQYGFTSDQFHKAESSFVDAVRDWSDLEKKIKDTKATLSGASNLGPQWIQISANVKGLARAIDDANKGTLQSNFALPTTSQATAQGLNMGAGLTSGFQAGMQAHSPSLIERTLMAISAQAKVTLNDLMALAPAFAMIGSKMMSVLPPVMAGGGASKMTLSPTLGVGAGTSALATASNMSATTGSPAIAGVTTSSPATSAGGITVQQLIVREEADIQRIARLLFRMQQNQLRPKGYTP